MKSRGMDKYFSNNSEDAILFSHEPSVDFSC